MNKKIAICESGKKVDNQVSASEERTVVKQVRSVRAESPFENVSLVTYKRS